MSSPQYLAPDPFQHVIHFMLRVPSVRRKVRSKMDEAKLHIENQLVPKGADVVRHLSLPNKGKTPEWILEEMQIMDTEMGNVSWRHGKLSGAVYRASVLPFMFSISTNLFHRRRRGPREGHRSGVPAVLRLQPHSPRCFSCRPQDGS
jgi:hypothetical protein